MLKYRKTLGNIDPSFLLCVLIVATIAGSACRRSAAVADVTIDSGDEKVATENLAAAEPLYEGREDLLKIRKAIALLRQARTADYGNYEAAWKLARADYYLGQHTTNGDERDDLFREGIESGKAAKQLGPDKPDGHFWLGANYGGTAEHSTLSNLSSVQDIRQEMEAVLKLDEGYQLGSAYMGLGQLYLQAPRVLGGDTEKAIGYLEKGLKFGANNSLLRVHLAEGYAAANRDGDARKQIDFVLSMTPSPGYAPEHKDALTKAKKLQEKLATH